MSDRQDFRISFYDRQVAKIAQALRDIADDVERHGQPHSSPGVTGTPRYLAAAEQVNHALTWGIANLGAYRLFDAAHHADMAETEAQDAPDEESWPLHAVAAAETHRAALLSLVFGGRGDVDALVAHNIREYAALTTPPAPDTEESHE